MKTIFYAWQSDLPNNTNRTFVEKCLERAIRELNKDLPESERLQLDKDTLDVPGMVVISDVILEKIEGCAVFVGDLSIVTAARSGRQMPNGNVMFELGYAMRSLSDRRVVAVFNEAFGPLQDLPFDIRHRRHPLTYSLSADASEETRRDQRETLVSALVHALRGSVTHVEESEEAEPAKPTFLTGLGSFEMPARFEPGRVIADVDAGVPGVKADGKVIYRHAPHAFLDLRPAQGRSTESYIALRARVLSANLLAFGPRGTQWIGRNENGIMAGDIFSHPQHPNALCFTQLYKSTGELYGIDQAVVGNDGARSFIHAQRLYEDFTRTLASYLEFFRKNPDLAPPLRLYAGLEMIRDSYLAISGSDGLRFVGPCVENKLWHAVDEVALDSQPKDLLRPLFEKLWDSVELTFEVPIG